VATPVRLVPLCAASPHNSVLMNASYGLSLPPARSRFVFLRSANYPVVRDRSLPYIVFRKVYLVCGRPDLASAGPIPFRPGPRSAGKAETTANRCPAEFRLIVEPPALVHTRPSSSPTGQSARTLGYFFLFFLTLIYGGLDSLAVYHPHPCFGHLFTNKTAAHGMDVLVGIWKGSTMKSFTASLPPRAPLPSPALSSCSGGLLCGPSSRSGNGPFPYCRNSGQASR